MSDWPAFIEANTQILSPPLLPELRLYLASEVTPLWQATEALLERTGLPPPFWAFAWPGGQALARHLLDRPELARGRIVLDFAAGSGIAAIAAARAGAARVLASEIDPAACAAIGLNAALNGAAIETVAADLTQSADCAAELILAGDVCYERGMAEGAISWLRLQARLGATVLLADPGRAYRPQDGLEELARYRVPTSRDLEDSEERRAVVWRLEAAAAPAG
jgi:predicted nicotinamide N-methyase